MKNTFPQYEKCYPTITKSYSLGSEKNYSLQWYLMQDSVITDYSYYGKIGKLEKKMIDLKPGVVLI